MLTRRQKEILDFVKKYTDQKGLSPSLEEIRKHFRLKSVSTIHQHLEALKFKGYLNREKNQKRGIEIKDIDSLVQVPLLGKISAGFPIEAIRDKEVLAVPKSKVPFSDVYALRVVGDSMIDENINDGDIILVKQQDTAEDGQKVVALIDNHEVTLKRFFKEETRIRLMPANAKMQPIFVKNVRIQGKVVGLVRRYGKN